MSSFAKLFHCLNTRITHSELTPQFCHPLRHIIIISPITAKKPQTYQSIHQTVMTGFTICPVNLMNLSLTCFLTLPHINILYFPQNITQWRHYYRDTSYTPLQHFCKIPNFLVKVEILGTVLPIVA